MPHHDWHAPKRARLLKYVDHLNFPRVVGELVRNDSEMKRCSYSAAFPKTETDDLPRIIYRLNRRTPGLDRQETYKPRLRYSFSNDDGTLTEIWAQWMTCIFQFDVCAGSAEEADELVWKLDCLLRNSVGVFLSLGAREMTFDEQLQDSTLPDMPGAVTRSLRWQVILEALESRTLPTLQEVRVRTFLPQEEAEEVVERGNYEDDPDLDVLAATFIGDVYHVNDEVSPATTASDGTLTREGDDYVQGVDFKLLYDPKSAKSAIRWLEAGKRPAPGATYYVRFSHWTAHNTLYLPG